MRIAFIDDYQAVAVGMAPWKEQIPGAEIYSFTEHLESDHLVEQLAPFDVVVAMRERTRFDSVVLRSLPALRLLVTTGMRNAAIDLAAAADLGITVCGTRSSGNGPLELAWGLILAVLRGICSEDAALRAGHWQVGLGGSLAGRTLGVVGLGRLGSKVATVGRAFNMQAVAWSPNLTAERATAVGVTAVDKSTLFETADVVTVHMVLSDRTAGLVGREDLERMRPSAILVNTSRAGLVDTAALVDLLRSGRLGGAGLDVFDSEPLSPDHPLCHCPRTVLTPHIGYVTREAYEVYYRDALEDIQAYRAGMPVRVLR